MNDWNPGKRTLVAEWTGHFRGDRPERQAANDKQDHEAPSVLLPWKNTIMKVITLAMKAHRRNKAFTCCSTYCWFLCSNWKLKGKSENELATFSNLKFMF